MIGGSTGKRHASTPIAVRGLDLAGLLLDGLHDGALLADEVREGRGVDLDNSLLFVVYICVCIYMCIYIYIYVFIVRLMLLLVFFVYSYLDGP